MIVSGLVLTAVGDSNQDVEDLGIPGDQTRAVQRVVFAEDYTNTGCVPCASHNPAWAGAIEAKGYDKVAPAFLHVWWPTIPDQWNQYKDMTFCVDHRRSMLEVNSAPDPWLDGENVPHHRSQAEYETMIDDKAAVPANISISTSGYIDPITRFGTVSIQLEAVENLVPGDYRLMILLWENNVSRYAPYPNGEMEQDWAVWELIPDDLGQEIWTNGSTVGETLDIGRSFVAGADWDLNEVGATIFVQNFNNLFVEQAHVELFRGSSPTHDVSEIPNVMKLDYNTSESSVINCTIFNSGTSDETNVEVNLTLDGVAQSTQMIPFLAADTSLDLDFPWIAPSVSGFYSLGIEVTPVPGETDIANNIWEQKIEVFKWSKLWTSPIDFNITLSQGKVGFDNLTLGNNGTDNLDFGLVIGTQVETFSSPAWIGSGLLDSCGNVFNVTNSTTLYEISNYLAITRSTDLYFFVYKGTGPTGTFIKVMDKYVAKTGKGTKWFSSGAMNVDLIAGNHYYIGVAWGFADRCFLKPHCTSETLPVDASFGKIETGTYLLSGFPPPVIIDQTRSNYRVFHQRITSSSDDSSWLTTTPDTGIVPVSSQADSMLTLDTTLLSAGFYQTNISILSNEPNDIQHDVQVNLTVTMPLCGGKRTSFAEDFTNWGCGPCAVHNPDWETAITNFGYANVTPAYVHVDWPSPIDPINNYGNMNTQAGNRTSLLSVGAVPSAWVDGEQVGVRQTVDYYEAIFEEKNAIPSNVKITTNGTIDGGGAGVLNARFEALEDMPPGDYRAMTYIWEDNIDLVTRFGSAAANGETTWRWGVWLMLPDDQGQAIWSTGASKGDIVDISRIFQCEPSWIINEMGATVFLQNFDDLYVEQSAVDLFQGIPPAQPSNDLQVLGKKIKTDMEAGKSYNPECVIYNLGTTDEIDVEVKLTLDGGTELIHIVPFIESNHGVFVNFNWNAPALAGTYQLGFNVTPVPGETNVADNIWVKTVNVSYKPDIWISPSEFTFSVALGGSESNTLTVGNDGTDFLDYSVEIGTFQDEVGETTMPISWTNGFRGNVYQSDITTTLWEIQMYLNKSIASPMYFYVYECDTESGLYNQIDEIFIASAGPGATWYTSGPTSTPLSAGKYYFVFASWSGTAEHYLGSQSLPQTSFGSTLTPMGGNGAGPINPILSLPKATSYSPPYLQRLTTGPGSSPWLTVVPDSGTLGAGANIDLTVNVNASAIPGGIYNSVIYLASNDDDEAFILVSVDLYVSSETHDVAVLSMTAEGTMKSGELVWVNGTIINVGSSDESSVEVQLLVDALVEDSTIIPIITSTNTADITFLWVVPIGTQPNTQINLTLYIVPVADEFVIFNNTYSIVVQITSDYVIIYEDFEDPLNLSWSAYSSDDTYGFNQRYTNIKHTGSYSWAMAITEGVHPNLNELILQLDATNYVSIELSFWAMEVGDEYHVMPDTFIDHHNSDGVAVSNDGINWVKLMQYPASGGGWTEYGSYFVEDNITWTDTVYIKFQQFDNQPVTTFMDGLLWDDIELNISISPDMPFNIPISVVTDGWEFISFPYEGLSGNVTDVLNDSANGDGGTTWDIVQWFDAQAQEWRSYSIYKPPSVNNLPEVNNTMGLWIHITANGGDGYLSVGPATSPTLTNIPLYSGWNLVGYPSFIQKSITDALIGTGYDMPVEGFNATAPYRLTALLDSYEMKPGEAYWIHVPADTVWIVDW